MAYWTFTAARGGKVTRALVCLARLLSFRSCALSTHGASPPQAQWRRLRRMLVGLCVGFVSLVITHLRPRQMPGNWEAIASPDG
jgi:hypothetical protein